MKKPSFSESELATMRQFYQNEMAATVAKLEHLQSVLAKLEGNSPSYEIKINKDVSASSTAALDVSIDEDEDGSTVPVAPIVKKRHKKRGPKPIWGTFIIKRLRQLERPVTYADLIDDAMAFKKVPDTKRKATRDAIMNSAFRLRNIQGKINTYRKKGKKEVFVGLAKWFDTDGNLIADYAKRIRT